MKYQKKVWKENFKLFLFSFNTRSGWEVKKGAFWWKTATRGVCRRHETLLKKKLWLRCFLVNFANFLRTSILKKVYERLLLLCLYFQLQNAKAMILKQIKIIKTKRLHLRCLTGLWICLCRKLQKTRWFFLPSISRK